MQKKKIFIEIEVPSQVKKRLIKKVSQWENMPVKWSKEESLHVTVAFVGFVDESVVPDICEKVSLACQQMESFDLDFDKIVLSPTPLDPRMVSLVGPASEQLKQLNGLVEEALDMHKQDRKEFRPHITLGRIRKLKWDELEEKPVIDEKYKTVVPVDSVQVMESKGGGAEYVLLEECPLA
jgi:RNA 2',3'-cyclic 3'-phosphodiesterase